MIDRPTQLICVLALTVAVAGPSEALEHLPLAPGDQAPDVQVQDHTGRWLQLSELWAEGPVLLYFYPKDFTPNCTVETLGFRDAGESFYQAGVRVVGASINTAGSHRRFARSLGLGFPLLADVHGQLARAFGVDLEVQGFVVARRVTFLIDEGGEIAWVWDPVDPEGHAEDTLANAYRLGLTNLEAEPGGAAHGASDAGDLADAAEQGDAAAPGNQPLSSNVTAKARRQLPQHTASTSASEKPRALSASGTDE